MCFNSVKILVFVFMREVFYFYGCSEEIVSDRDVKFTVIFCQGIGQK